MALPILEEKRRTDGQRWGAEHSTLSELEILASCVLSCSTHCMSLRGHDRNVHGLNEKGKGGGMQIRPP